VIRGTAAILGVAASVIALAAGAAPAGAATPHVKHVFIVVLENEDGDVTFGPDSRIPYLSRTMRSQGAYLPNYYATGHLSLDNYISMVSGQAPNPQTQADCPTFTDFISLSGPDADGQFVNPLGGCVYPPQVQTIANQLEAAGLTWKGYMEDMAAKAPAEPASCRHPDIGAVDDTQTAEAGDQYATRHNPFVYFHSIIDTPSCAQNDVDLSHLVPDLASAATTPNYSFITPDLCNDGHDEPCVDGQPGGMTQANTFLQGLIPRITASPGFKDRGMVIVTFDEAETHDSSACCNEQPGPNTPNPGGPTPGPGGGKIGAVFLSPCIRPGTTTEEAYNHYSLLRSIEDNFGLPHLGFAGQAGLRPFGEDILNRQGCSRGITLKVRPKRPPAGKKVKFRFRARSEVPACITGVAIRFAGRRVTTNAVGKAKLKMRAPGGKHRAKAFTADCGSARARVRARR
jgi:phosphatidylinositol-3-phosphatase